MVAAAGAVYFIALREPPAPRERPTAQTAERTPETAATVTPPVTPAKTSPVAISPAKTPLVVIPPVEKKPVPQKPADDDRAWRNEAKGEYLETLKAKESRMSALAKQVGSLSRPEKEFALQALKTVGANYAAIDQLPDEIVKAAESLAPQYIRAVRRERQMQNGEYAELVNAGLAAARHPIETRKRLYAEFVTATGGDAEWSFVSLFDDLEAGEMDAVSEAVAKLKAGGLAKLTKAQRVLLLKAGALELFRRELGY